MISNNGDANVDVQLQVSPKGCTSSIEWLYKMPARGCASVTDWLFKCNRPTDQPYRRNCKQHKGGEQVDNNDRPRRAKYLIIAAT